MQINYSLFGTGYLPRSNNSLKQNNQNRTYLSSPIADTVCFSGLTKKMKKHTYIDGQRDIKKIVDARADKNLIVGQLPKFIMEKLPVENRKEAIFDIYNTFSEITQELRDFDESKVYTLDEITKRRNKSTVEKFDNIMKKYNLVSKWDECDLEYLGKGGKGAAYKLTGLRDFKGKREDEFVIKVFHVIEGKDWQYSKSHGCYAEINSAQYWINNVGTNTNRGKFFWGDLRSGYMINKYVDEDVRLPERTIDPYEYGLKCTDEDAAKKHNVCKGYSYDWGGVRVVNRLKNGDKYARAILNEIKNTPEKYRAQTWERLMSRKDGYAEGRQAGLAMAIKYLDNKPYYFEKCLALHKPKVDQGLSYALKYMPYKEAIKYFERLVQTDDSVTQVVLFNEIPLLAMKHRDDKIKDDLQTTRSEILCSRVKAYYDIAEAYAKPDTIEHLASFLHLLPKDDFRPYFKRLAAIQNDDLHDRMIYKFSNVERDDYFFVLKQLAKNVKSDVLREKIRAHFNYVNEVQAAKLEKLLEENS
ncbi:MAG: hypothetical protein NC191_05135 [Muribaculaceae bacterium]|nr:hypothetical protein [Muribaculaceae bacterium]